MQGGKIPVSSLQLIGRPRGEAELLNAGRIVETKLAPETRAALAAARQR
jgi:hypothetical protein